MNIAILGFGSQGTSALKHWSSNDNKITVCDRNEGLELPKDVKAKLGPNYLENLDEFDLLVRSPSLHPQAILDANPTTPDILNKTTTNTSEFFRVCPTKNIIGVTGTKGKGTTSTLIANMLTSTGKRVHLGGNIGTPPLELLAEKIKSTDWVVLELANFQLIDLRYSPKIAVCVMVEPEHQDWHHNLNEYLEAKQQLFRHQQKSDVSIYFAQNAYSQQIASVSNGQKIPYFQEPGAYVENYSIMIDGAMICKTSEIGLPGKHNWQNVCAALTAVWQITQDIDAIRQTIRELKSLPFRIELRRKVDGVAYYNDSFATAPGATMAAIDAINAPKILLIGGHDRGLDLTPLATCIKEHSQTIRKVVAYGASGQRVTNALQEHGFTGVSLNESSDLASVVAEARSYAQSGDAIVLSPAFASFDMFKNFEERGNAFNQIVENLS